MTDESKFCHQLTSLFHIVFSPWEIFSKIKPVEVERQLAEKKHFETFFP
jgi:hypothetical protein